MHFLWKEIYCSKSSCFPFLKTNCLINAVEKNVFTLAPKGLFTWSYKLDLWYKMEVSIVTDQPLVCENQCKLSGDLISNKNIENIFSFLHPFRLSENRPTYLQTFLIPKYSSSSIPKSFTKPAPSFFSPSLRLFGSRMFSWGEWRQRSQNPSHSTWIGRGVLQYPWVLGVFSVLECQVPRREGFSALHSCRYCCSHNSNCILANGKEPE